MADVVAPGYVEAMPFRWLTERRRRRIEAQPFPEAWSEVLTRNVANFLFLDAEEQEHLRNLVQVFIEEKHWEGCGGLELTDEIKVTIAAEACLLLLGRDHALYDDVTSILVYPSTVVAPERRRGFFDHTVAPDEGQRALLGEAHLGGPVILSWDAALRGARNAKDGRNVVIHEFAHKIDMLDHHADGTPPLETRAELRTWATVAEAGFLALREGAERGQRTFLDDYGATNEAEFFAVATETFFERPVELEAEMPELYALLEGYFRQDPAARRRRSPPR